MAAIAQERSTPTDVGLGNPLRRLWSHFLLRRIAKAIFTVYFVSSLIFFLVRLLPGSPVEVYINQLVTQYGYSYDVAADQARSLFSVDPNKPLALQYLDYLRQVAQGDLGQSMLSPGVRVKAWPADDDPILKNAPYADGIPTMLLYTGRLEPV